ncbi:MAG: putative 2OG-Fe(II) oxygenase, partial [Rhodospirillales bacterium]
AHINLGNVLLKMGQPDEAAAHYRQALKLKPDYAEASLNLAGVLNEQQQPQDAIAVLNRALNAAPRNENLFYPLIRLLLGQGDLRGALAACDGCLRADPLHTRAKALKGYILNDMGERNAAEHLLDFERLIKTARIDTAPGYDSLAAFNDALKRHILDHPSLEYEPGQKSTKFGSQTAHLQHETSGPLAQLRELITTAVVDYRERIAAEPPHPFFAHIPERFSLNIWGTVLSRPGHQRPHFHPAGWLSGVYYVTLPGAVRTTDAGNAGWIEFGQPHGFDFKAPPPTRALCPEAGLIVLFPSYFYHRTIPTDAGAGADASANGPSYDHEPRISIAFDAVPQG